MGLGMYGTDGDKYELSFGISGLNILDTRGKNIRALNAPSVQE